MKIEAAKRLQITAAYEGTKSKDLYAYLKSLLPSVRLYKPGPGHKIKRPSYLSGRIKDTDAHALGTALLKDNWKGIKASKPAVDGSKLHYIFYTPKGDEFKFTPYVCLYKPSKSGDSHIVVEHMTGAAIRESAFLNKLNRRVNRLAPKPAEPVRRSGGGAGGSY